MKAFLKFFSQVQLVSQAIWEACLCLFLESTKATSLDKYGLPLALLCPPTTIRLVAFLAPTLLSEPGLSLVLSPGLSLLPKALSNIAPYLLYVQCPLALSEITLLPLFTGDHTPGQTQVLFTLRRPVGISEKGMRGPVIEQYLGGGSSVSAPINDNASLESAYGFHKEAVPRSLHCGGSTGAGTGCCCGLALHSSKIS